MPQEPIRITTEAAAPGTSGGRQMGELAHNPEPIRITTKEGETIVLLAHSPSGPLVPYTAASEGTATFLLSPAGLELLISRAAKFRRPPQSLFKNETHHTIGSSSSDAHAA